MVIGLSFYFLFVETLVFFRLAMKLKKMRKNWKRMFDLLFFLLRNHYMVVL